MARPRPEIARAPLSIDAVTLVCLLGGDTLGPLVHPEEWSVLQLSPMFWFGVALLVSRHLVWPTPPLFEELWSRLRSAVAAPAAPRLLALAAVTRFGVLAVGLAASLSYPATIGRPRVADSTIENLTARWDGLWYLNIARNGYRWSPERREREQNIAFFPGYPLLMRVAGDLVTVPAKLLRSPALFGGGNARIIWGGTLISLLCFALALPRLYRIAHGDTGDDELAIRSCVLLATYPFALFFSVPYSESLALLALLSLVLAWRRGDARGGAAWGIVLGLCRSNGWTVAVALVLDGLLSRPAAWKQRWSWIAVAVSPLAGAAIYSGYIYTLTGEPFEWAAAQSAWSGGVHPAHFFTRRWDTIAGGGLIAYLSRSPVDALTFASAITMGLAAIWLAVERRWLYAAIVAAYLAPAVAIDLPATGRMTALLFPTFILAASRVRGVPYVTLVTAFAVGQAWLAWRFFLWNTPY